MKIDWQKVKETVEWLYRLLRPRTHNRVALIVVLAGVGILASPFWEPYLRAILERMFSVKIDPPTHPLFGLGLIVVALLYHYGAMRIEHAGHASDADARKQRNYQIVEHDKKLATRTRKIFPERQKQKLVSDLLNEHAYWDSQSRILGETVDFLDSAETNFLNDELKKHAKNFADTSAELLKYMGLRFFVYPDRQTREPLRFAMQPNWNMDRQGNGSDEQVRKYDALARELERLTNRMSDSYDELIRSFHTHLLD